MRRDDRWHVEKGDDTIAQAVIAYLQASNAPQDYCDALCKVLESHRAKGDVPGWWETVRDYVRENAHRNGWTVELFCRWTGWGRPEAIQDHLSGRALGWGGTIRDSLGVLKRYLQAVAEPISLDWLRKIKAEDERAAVQAAALAIVRNAQLDREIAVKARARAKAEADFQNFPVVAPRIDPAKPRHSQFFLFVCPYCSHSEEIGLWNTTKTCSQCKKQVRITRQ